MFGLTIGIGIDTGAHLDFNEESTAISLVFMNPLFTVSDPANATVIVAKIKSAPSFNLLKAEIHNLMYQGSLNYMTPNIEIEKLTNYNRVIYETLLSLNENYQIQQNGLQVIENTRVGNEIQFKIRNRLKRYSTIYAYKYKDGQLTKTDIEVKDGNLGYGPFEWIDCGSYDWAECWINIFTWNWEDQITQETDFFAVNVENAEKIYLKCYGLGVADGKFPAIDDEAYLGGALAMAKTVVFDIVKPTVEVVTGIKKFPNAGDLRGRDNDDPLSKLIMNYYEKLFKSSSTYTKFLEAANGALGSGNAKKEVMKTFWNVTKSFLIDEKNVELYIEILKKHVTLSTAQRAALNKTFTAAFQMKAAADIMENSLNLDEAVYATLATNWVTEFRINIDGVFEELDIPSNGLVAYYPFNGNTNDASGNGNHGTVKGSVTLTTDRKGNSNSAYNFGGYYNKGYIKVPASSSLQFNQDITISTWVKLNDSGGMDGWGNYNATNAAFTVLGKDGGRNGICLDVNSNGGVGFPYLWDKSNQAAGVNYTYNTGFFDWVHIVAVNNGNKMALYLNGVKVQENSNINGNINAVNNLAMYIGVNNDLQSGYGEAFWSPFNGKIDDVRIYNRALTDSEIQALYNE
jgi:hypothetical protein